MIISEQEVEPPQKKTKLHSPQPPPTIYHHQRPCQSFSSLPNELAVNCFARISKQYYPSLCLVSKTFHSLLSSGELYAARSQIGTTELCLYICLKISTPLLSARRWSSLWLKPNPNLTDGRIQERSSGNRFVPFPNYPPPPLPYSKSTVTIGSEIYFLGGPINDNVQPTSAVRVYNCQNQTWRDLPNMKMERAHASACVLDDKIYVMGGCRAWFKHESWFELFDIKTQTWETLPANPDIKVRLGCTVRKIGAVEGKIYVKTETELLDWVYDVKKGKWSVADGHLGLLWSSSWCVIENVMYCYSFANSRYLWYDLEGREWREVKGLEVLRKYRSFSNAFPSGMVELVNYGGKLAIIWDRFERRGRSHNKNIWCAVVSMDKWLGPGVMFMGRIEWVDVVLTVPKSYNFMRSLAISV